MYNGYLERIINFIGKLHLQVQKGQLIRIIGLDCWYLKNKILKYYPNVKFCVFIYEYQLEIIKKKILQISSKYLYFAYKV